MARVFVQNYRARLYSFFNAVLTDLKKDLKTSYTAFCALLDAGGTLFADLPVAKKLYYDQENPFPGPRRRAHDGLRLLPPRKVHPAEGADYTPAQWEKANAQFEALVNQYVDKYDKLSNEDKKEINAAIGKYTATALKCGVADGLKQINALLKKVPSAIDTAAEGAKGFFEELGL